MQGLDDLCGQCESLPLIAVVFPACNPCVTSRFQLPAALRRTGPVALVQTLDRLILHQSKKKKKLKQNTAAEKNTHTQMEALTDTDRQIPGRMSTWLAEHIWHKRALHSLYQSN